MVQVFADPGAIEGTFFLLLKRYLQTTGICFCDYQSFEDFCQKVYCCPKVSYPDGFVLMEIQNFQYAIHNLHTLGSLRRIEGIYPCRAVHYELPLIFIYYLIQYIHYLRLCSYKQDELFYQH